METRQITPQSKISVDISTEFYKRIQDLTIYFSQLKSLEEIKVTIQNIKDDKVLDDYEAGFETLLILCNSVEEAATAQNLVETVKVPEQAS